MAMVVGIGDSGKSAYSLLIKNGYMPIFYDDQFSQFEYYEGIFKDLKFVVVSPGIPPDHKVLNKARELDIDVFSEIELAYRLRSSNSQIVAVTGTNGKTTVTSMIDSILGEDSCACGNIGVAWSSVCDDDKKYNCLELSSFQLSNVKTFKPKVSIILNFAPDHIDYHGSFEEYIKSKMKICKNQTKEDFLIYNADDDLVSKLIEPYEGQKFYFALNKKNGNGVYIENNSVCLEIEDEKKVLFDLEDFRILGHHNIRNILASTMAAALLGVAPKEVKTAILNYKFFPYRNSKVNVNLKYVVYNDSKSTNLASTLSAIDCFDGSIVLIVGGRGKNEDYSALFEKRDKLKNIFAYGEASDQFVCAAKKCHYSDIVQIPSFEECVLRALDVCDKNDVLLFSPACSSFDCFSSYRARGEFFEKLVLQYSVRNKGQE